MVVHACNHSTWEEEAGQSDIQGHHLLLSEFEASLVYTMSSKNSPNYIIKILSQKRKKKASAIYLLSANRWQAASTQTCFCL